MRTLVGIPPGAGAWSAAASSSSSSSDDESDCWGLAGAVVAGDGGAAPTCLLLKLSVRSGGLTPPGGSSPRWPLFAAPTPLPELSAQRGRCVFLERSDAGKACSFQALSAKRWVAVHVIALATTPYTVLSRKQSRRGKPSFTFKQALGLPKELSWSITKLTCHWRVQ